MASVEELQNEYCKTMFKIKNIKEDILKLQNELMKEENLLHELIDEYIKEVEDL